MSVGYAELHCLSNFSFQRGASSAQELFARARQHGYDALAITDEASLAGIVRAWQAAQESGLKLIVGSEIQLENGPKLVLLVENLTGYQSLCRLLTLARRRAGKGEYCLRLEDLTDALDGLLGLWLPRHGQDEEHGRQLQPLLPGSVAGSRAAPWAGRCAQAGSTAGSGRPARSALCRQR